MLIKRDPFARKELYRERVYNLYAIRKRCVRCGMLKQTRTPGGRYYLYKYWIERDSKNGRREEVNGLFCSENCRKSYQE